MFRCRQHVSRRLPVRTTLWSRIETFAFDRRTTMKNVPRFQSGSLEEEGAVKVYLFILLQQRAWEQNLGNLPFSANPLFL